MWKPESATLVEEEEWKPKSAVLIEPTPKKEISPKTTPITEALKAVEPSPQDLDPALATRVGLPTIPDPSAPPEGFVPDLEQPSEKIQRPGPTFRTTPRDIRPPEEAIEAGSLVKRFGKQLTNAFARIGETVISSPLSPIGITGEHRHRIQADKELAASGFRGGPAQRKQLIDARASQLAAAEYVPKFKVEKPKKTSEKVADVAAGLTAFLSQLALTRKILPKGTSEPLIWEVQNQLAGDIPGKGLAMANAYGIIGKIPAVSVGGKVAKIGTQSSLLGGITAAAGGDTEDIIIAALIPVAFGAYSSARGKISDVQMVKAWRQKLPFTRDIPMKSSLKYAQAMRSAFQLGKTKDFRLKGKQYQQWHKRYGKSVDTFLKEANTAFEATQPPKPIGLLPEPTPTVVAKPPVDRQAAEVTAMDAELRQIQRQPPTVAKITPVRPTEAITPTKPTVAAADWWEREGRRIVDERLAKSPEFQEALREYEKAIEAAETNTVKSKQKALDLAQRKAGRAMKRIDIEMDKRVMREHLQAIKEVPPTPKPTVTAAEAAEAERLEKIAKLTGPEARKVRWKAAREAKAKAEELIRPTPKPEVAAKPKLVDLGPAPEVKAKERANVLMLTEVQKILEEKAFISEKGKIRPGARLLAKQFIGKTDIRKMTEDELAKFGQLLKKLPEPRLVHGKLVPPSIPRTTALTKAAFFKRRFKRPTPVMFVTDQSYYAEKLGVKSIVEPLEKAKVRFDLERRSAAHELDKRGELIDKVGKTTSREKAIAKIKNIPTKAREEMGNLLDSYEEAPANLDPQKKKIFYWHRNLRRTILQKQNEARAKLDIPLIKSRKAYQRHIATDIAREMLAGRYPFPEGIKFWSGLSSGKKIFNPMEFQRKLEEDVYGLFTKDPIKADKAMMYNALKEIHLTQPLKFFNAQMSALGKDLPEYKSLSLEEKQRLQASVIPASTRRWLIDYVRTVIKGQQTQTDEWVNNLVTQTGLRGLFNKALHPFGRTVSQKPITHFFQTTGRMQMAGVIGTRPKLIIRNKFQLTHNLGLYTIKANVRAFLPPSSQLKKLLDESLFLKSYTGLEELPVDMAKKVEQIWHKGYQWSAVSNARQAMECAYWDTLELIENPKYKNVGFADPKRTYKEPHEYLYPSEKQKILKEMEFGASATQFHYIAMGMPQVFRHKSLIPFTRLTSWWMNYFAKFHREAIHRGLSGSPSWDSDIKLPWSRRLGWLRYVILGGLILNTLGYTRSYLFGAAPTGWPPAIQFAGNLYLYLITLGSDEKWKQSKNKLAKKRMFSALKTFVPGYIAYKDVEAIWSGRKDLSSLFFYKKYKKKQEGKRKKRMEREKRMLRG